MVPQRRVDLKVVPGTVGGERQPPGAGPEPGPPRGLFGRHAVPPASVASPREAGLRPAEVLILLYLAVTASLMVVLQQTQLRTWGALALAHLIAGAAILRVAASPPPAKRFLRLLRDFYPLAGLLLFYAEYAWLTGLVGAGTHDALIAGLEQRLLGFQPSQELRRWWPWPWLSQYLHGAYFGYYLIPALLVFTLYARGRWRAFQESLTTILLAFFSCGLVFIAFPVAGPYHHVGIPDLGPLGGGIAAAAHAVVQRGSSVGTALPSSHAAVAVAVWVAALRLSPRVFWILVLVVPALVVGTVYGGFHYALDAVAGVVWGVGAGLLGPKLHAFLAERLPRASGRPRAASGASLPRMGGGS